MLLYTPDIYDSGSLLYEDREIPIRTNSLIPNNLIYKRDSSFSLARSTGDVRVGYTAIARDITLDYWLRIRKSEWLLIGPIHYLAWAGEWHEVDRLYCLGLIYEVYAYHRSIGCMHRQEVLSFLGRTEYGRVVEPVLVNHYWHPEDLV